MEVYGKQVIVRLLHSGTITVTLEGSGTPPTVVSSVIDILLEIALNL
jgi:hypothetical protein